jgi:hypothetical protein
MNKKYALLILVTISIIFVIVMFTFILINDSDNVITNKGNPTSYVSYVNSVNNNLSYPVTANVKTINYTHPSGKFGYKYPNNWELLPERQEMGLRPKDYHCVDACYNEIVTIIYFEGKGVNLRSQAMEYDGGLESEWVDVVISNKTGIYYNYSSSNLSNDIYWFSNGTDAVKVMFRKYNAYPSDGHKDNSQYETDFNVILNSFVFY